MGENSFTIARRNFFSQDQVQLLQFKTYGMHLYLKHHPPRCQGRFFASYKRFSGKEGVTAAKQRGTQVPKGSLQQLRNT